MSYEKKFLKVLEGTTLTIAEPAYLLTRDSQTGGINLIKTTPVKDFFIGANGSITVKTQNSIYRN